MKDEKNQVSPDSVYELLEEKEVENQDLKNVLFGLVEYLSRISTNIDDLIQAIEAIESAEDDEEA